jgi:hypothetical protein
MDHARGLNRPDFAIRLVWKGQCLRIKLSVRRSSLHVSYLFVGVDGRFEVVRARGFEYVDSKKVTA